MILVVTILIILFKDKLLKIMYPKTYSEIVSTYAEEYNVEENLIYAVIKAESNFDSNAVSNREAIGLMQIVEETAIDVAKQNQIDVDTENITEDFFNLLCKGINKRFKLESKYMNKIDKYRYKKLGKQIRQQYGLWARIKRTLGLAPKLSEPSEVTSPQENLEVVKLSEEQSYIEDLQKELNNTKLKFEQLRKQQIEQQVTQSIDYEEDNL